MSGPAPGGPAAHVVRRETGLGRITLIEDSPSVGTGPFRDGQFEIAETGEVMAFETTVRAYEELAIVRSASLRTATIAAVVRREQADIGIEGENVTRAVLAQDGA